jgi:hypothetical protein
MSSKRKFEDLQIPVARHVEAGESVPSPQGSEPAPVLSEDAAAPIIIPTFHPCHLSLPEGCYQLSITNTPPGSPTRLRSSYRLGTLRVVKSGATYAISGDTYRYSWIDLILTRGTGIPSFGPTTIPIYPRGRYNSYLKVVAVNIPILSRGPCRINLTVEEYDYTQPPAGAFDGSFPTAPSRTMDIYLTPVTPPTGFSGPYFSGQVYIGGVLQGNLSVSLGWVNAMVRRATVEIHTMTGSVAPAPVPITGGNEFIDTIYAKAKWQLTVLKDPTPVPVPATTPPTVTTNCWLSGTLHNVMTALSDFSSVNLDTTWYMHVLVVQARLGCGRGVMFDQINVPREGVATFCEDGYPSTDSAFFGTAANQMQKNVPRAFLRSCTHEITHGFNQIHQEQEGGADNSIMTTTPSVADTIHAAGGTFPADINLDFNEHVRHHLQHLPDPIIRPGGMSFTAGHNGIPIPTADVGENAEEIVEHPSLELSLKAKKQRVKIGEPLQLIWELANSGDSPVNAPNFLGIEHDFADLSIVKPDGSTLDVAPFVIVCDSSQLTTFNPGDKRTAQHDLFWSTQGFAFDSPGKHVVNLEVSWGAGDLKIGATASVEILVDHPVSEKDNDIIAQLMNDEVGKFVALGGHAYHLKEAVSRIGKVVREHHNHDVGKGMADYYDDKWAATAAKKQKPTTRSPKKPATRSRRK